MLQGAECFLMLPHYTLCVEPEGSLPCPQEPRNRETSITITYIPAGIRIEYVLNSSQERYHYATGTF
jgi:hypothetical protein